MEFAVRRREEYVLFDVFMNTPNPGDSHRHAGRCVEHMHQGRARRER